MRSITISHFVTLSTIIFMIGLCGTFINRRHLIVMLLCIELMLLGVNINMVAFSYFLKDLQGQVFTLFILTLAAAEAAIGLAILVLYYRHFKNISVELEEEKS
ncbi:MAG: NADH-quinone oxidoreductase subunit NuoK [Proteobacteria bacterium]|nr:NADH-quinone oxidoreductase subunit NuoK [Pseudomonadota bacterium]